MKIPKLVLLIITIAIISGCIGTKTTSAPTGTPTAVAPTGTHIATVASTETPIASTETPIASTETPSTVTTTTTTATSVEIKGFSFNPATVTIKKGTTVIWTNTDSVQHTVTSASNIFDSGKLNQRQTFSWTFVNTGSFNYGCSIHPNMKGIIVVTDTGTGITGGGTGTSGTGRY